MTHFAPPSARASIRRYLLAGLVIVLFLSVGVGGWVATTVLSGAVIAPSQVVVESYVKTVQHLTGGIVGELRVRNGDRVRAGDLLIRLDETQARAELAIVRKRLDELYARKARLTAERDGLEAIELPMELRARSGQREVAELIAGERRLFEARREVRLGQKAQLRERIAQLRKEIRGLTAQQEAKAVEIDLIAKELEGLRELWQKQLVPIARVISLEREAARLKGERGRLIAAAAQAEGQITETELQILQIDQDLQSEVATEIREVQAQIGEFVERRVAAEDKLRRLDIRAPQDGVVHQLAVHTAGAVIGAGDPIMLIVPDADALKIEARVAPRDIDQLHLGQTAVLRLTAFNQGTAPEINGVVTMIAADLTEEPETGAAYYLIRIAMPQAELARLGSLKLVPGMPVEAFIQTGERTALSYLLRPLHDQITRAFREE